MRRDAKGRFHSGRVCPPCLWNKAPGGGVNQVPLGVDIFTWALRCEVGPGGLFWFWEPPRERQDGEAQ